MDKPARVLLRLHPVLCAKIENGWMEYNMFICIYILYMYTYVYTLFFSLCTFCKFFHKRKMKKSQILKKNQFVNSVHRY